MRTYESFDVPVDGGALRVGRWSSSGGDAPVALAAHGVTANHVSWQLVGDLAKVTVVAPDLRGRGRSSSVEGPAGLHRHATDLLAVADHIGAPSVVVAGHSMGAFVAAAFHELFPDRTEGVVLVDGGLPLPEPPPGTTTDEALAAILGPAATRLTMTFGSTAEYLAFWRDHPALGPAWSSAIEDYLSYDLVGEPPGCRSSVQLRAVREDSTDMLDGGSAARRARALPRGSVMLRAPYDMFGAEGGFYPPDLVSEHAASFPAIDIRDVPDTNHDTILLSEDGSRAVAAALDAASGR